MTRLPGTGLPPFVDAVPPGAVLVDVRSAMDVRGRPGVLPGSVVVDLDADLAGPPGPAGRHPLPAPEAFAAALGARGLADDDAVVAHDGAGGVFAARLVWMLRATGREAALLEGATALRRGPLEDAPVVRPPVARTPVAWPVDRLADLEAAADAALLLDARPGERYRAEVPDVDVRRGHVPGAVSLPCREHVDPDGRLLPVDVLRARFAAAGWHAGAVSSCGSGVTACHTLLVAEHLGLPAGRLWPGSWSEWAATDRPAATGP